MPGILARFAIADTKICVFLLRSICQRAIEIDVEITILVPPFVSERRQPLGHERRQATDIQIVGVFRTLYFGNGGSQFFKRDRTPPVSTLPELGITVL